MIALRCLVLLGVALVPVSHAQQAARGQGPALWLGASLGRTLTFPGRDLGILSVDVNVVRARHWFGARASYMLYNIDSSESVSELGLLYGRSWGRGWYRALLGGGLALVDVCVETCRGGLGIGVPVAARFTARPMPVLGVGAQLLANLSTEAVVSGWALFVELGKLR